MIRSAHITVALHVLIWGALLVLPYFLLSPAGHQTKAGLFLCNYFTVTNVMHIGLFYFNAFFLYSRLMTRRRWVFYLLALALLVVVFYFFKRLILLSWFNALAADEAAFRFTFFPTVFFLVVSTIYRLVLDKMNYEREQTKREAKKLSMELKFLRSQVSPHFLFNVLNSLVAMARQHSNLLEPSLIRLSGLLRYMLHESDEKKVSVATEIEYLESYIALQRLRFQDDVTINTDIQHKDLSGTIEPMLLIPFVENAFKHGVAPVDDPFITISLKIDNRRLHFKVENKFSAADETKDADSGIGLTNVKARLNLLYPEKHKLSIAVRNNIFNVELSLQLK